MASKTLTECPTCDVKGAEVYRAESHPIVCEWMMNNTHRCAEHDELLRPSEKNSPSPDADDESVDPHGRLIQNAHA